MNLLKNVACNPEKTRPFESMKFKEHDSFRLFAQKIKDHEILENKVFRKRGVLQLLRINETLLTYSMFKRF